MSAKQKKKAKFANKLLQEVEIKDAFTDDMSGAIEVNIKTLKLRAGEVDLGTRGILTVSYGSHLIGKVDYIPLPPEGGVLTLDYKCFLQINDPDDTLMDSFVSTPFFFTLSVFTEEDHMSSLKKRKSGIKNKKSTRSVTDENVSLLYKQVSQIEPGKVLGQGNLDVLPLLLEGRKVERTVTLEAPGLHDTLFFGRPISDNPKLLVSLNDIKRSLLDFPLNNIMWLTVESIFNPSEPYFVDDAEYTIAFPIPQTEVVLEDPSSDESAAEENKLKDFGHTEFDSTRPVMKHRSLKTYKEFHSSNETLSSSVSTSSKGISPLKALSPNPSKLPGSSKNLGGKVPRLEPIRRVHAGGKSDQQGLQTPRIESRPDSSSSASTDHTSKGTPFEKSSINLSHESLYLDNTKQQTVQDGEIYFDRSGGGRIDKNKLISDTSPKSKSGSIRSDKMHSKGDDLKVHLRQLELNNRISDYSLIEIPQGSWSEEPQLDLRKSWSSLASICGGPSKHTQQIKPDSSGIFSKFEVDLQKKMEADSEPKIVWNMVRPYWLNQTEQQNITKKIFRHGLWPIEVVVNGGSQRSEREPAEEWKRSGDKDKLKKKPAPPKKLSSHKSYIAWLDLSPLLFPGKDSIRVVGQLQIFDKEEGEFLWGLQSTVAAKPAESLSLTVNESYSDNDKRGQSKKNYTKRDSTNKFNKLKRTNMKSSAKRDTESNSSEDSSSEVSRHNKFLMKNSLKNKSVIYSHLEGNRNDSESDEKNHSSSRLQFDSFHKVAQKFETKSSKFIQLEKDYQNLKAKYDRMVAAQKGSKIHVSDSEETIASSDISEILSLTKENKKKIEQIVEGDFEEKEIKKILLVEDGLEKWSVLEHKKLLMERQVLASLRKKMKEDLVLFEPEKFYNENDEPTFIVIEIQFLKPLVPKNSLEKIEADVRDLLPVRTDFSAATKERYTSCKFQSCLAKLTKFINFEYTDFMVFGEKNDEEKFFEHLINSRAHQRMTELLREGLAAYVQDVVGAPLAECHIMGPKWKDYIGWLYCRLMDEIHSVVNKFVMDTDRSTPLFFEDDSPNITNEELFVFTTEAAEERDSNRVKLYMSKILSDDDLTNAQCWSDYAVICLRLGDYPKAVECLREALLLNIRHKESLLMYAAILTMAGMFDEAELFFYALVEFHPFFSQGWITLHTFYLLIERSSAADAALINGTKCASRHKTKNVYKPIQLAWDNSWQTGNKSYYLNTAVYLLSFNLYEMAEVCLAQELENTGEKSETFIYYLAVCHHIQGRYQDSSSHLMKALSGGLALEADARLWVILGHNKWQQGMKKEAVQLYMEAISCEEPPGNLHMACIRAGYYFLEIEKAELAQQMFLRAVRNTGTPMGWLGLGIALYMLDQLEDAELALKEANNLDNRLAVAWAYLGLICLQRNKLEQFQQCIHEANRHGLNDLKLKKKMDDCLKNVVNQENAYYSV